MKPEDTHHSFPSHPHSPHTRSGVNVPGRENAANLIRGQLEALYTSHPNTTTQSDTQPAPAAKKAAEPQAKSTQNVIQPAQSGASAKLAVSAEEWQQYHSAWQDYYQKYYHRYYTGYVNKLVQNHNAQLAQHAHAPKEELEAPEEKKQELTKMRKKVLESAHATATKARGSRHFIPVAAAICVVLVFSFLQYNRVLMSNVQAYISPGAIDPQNIVVDPSTDIAVGPEPKLIIPKINVDVPVVYGIGADDKSQLAAMEHGVAHWPGGDWAKSVPGQAGNTVIAGHSSNDLFEAGDYKFIFSQLERLEKGDTIYANYEGKRYTYTVTKKDIILPVGQWQDIIKPTDKPMLVLVTCWPLGTAQKRMLVSAEQVSPDPAAVAPAPAQTDNVPTSTGMTGNSPTFLEWLGKLFS
jgi:sortase A